MTTRRLVPRTQLHKRFGAAVVLPAFAFFAVAARAIDLTDFDRLSTDDQGTYIGLLIVGAEDVLEAAGQADDAKKVHIMFTTRQPGDENTTGMVEFELNLAALQKADAENLAKDPDAKRLPVEIAMVATLKNNGIILPKSFMEVNKDFKPKDPVNPHPMAVPQFNQMPVQDQTRYIGEMVAVAGEILTKYKRPDLAANVKQFFATPPTGAAGPGLVELKNRLAIIGASKEPGADRIDVENVFVSILEETGVQISDSFLDAMKNFRPQSSSEAKQ